MLILILLFMQGVALTDLFFLVFDKVVNILGHQPTALNFHDCHANKNQVGSNADRRLF